MSEIFIGEYQLGYRNIRLYGTDGTGGSVIMTPKDKKSTQIRIGFNDDWPEVICTLLHEAYELSLVEMNVRYDNSPSFSTESSRFLFLVSHNKLDEVHTRVAYFLVWSQEDLKNAYNKFQKARKKKKK